MRWFANLGTGVKLILSFSLVLVGFMLLMLTAYRTITYLDHSTNDVYENDLLVLENLLKTEVNQNQSRAALLLMIASNTKEEQEKWNQIVKSETAAANDYFKTLLHLEQDYPKNHAKLVSIEKLREQYTETRDNQVIPLIIQGKGNEASQLITGAQNEQFNKIQNLMNELILDVEERSKTAVALADKETQQGINIFLTIGALTLLTVVGLIILLDRLISVPLKEITEAAEQIASGDLKDVKFKALGRKDEVGVLASTFATMSGWLQGVAGTAKQISNGDLTVDVTLQSSNDVLGIAFQTMIKNLRQMTSEISEAINYLSTSVNEISSATTQLASSANETATSVGETTSTIEEVKQTSKLASEKAKLVSDASQKSAEVSQTGKKAADEITNMTHQIHSQMDQIADSMVRLSEQSQMIGAIISTVDDLAQQSNLLSVNASIEAAKAGEQGKGFAIVAQEVKSLANQSREATNQVRSILSDIQKATSAAVMATEQGSKSVEEGVKKSTETSQSIMTLVDTVTNASHAATQIAATSHQQLVGMEQAAIAMENIKQASQQNVDSAKQLEVATNSIKELGVNLKRLVNQYTLHKEAAKK